MAPVTRCEARASHTGLEHGVQLEQILENFEQFRRKHIAQNRDIVRANTLAQLRIRELEARVLALEQERAEQSLEYGKQQAHAQRLQYALDCVRVGWETMAQGLEEAGVDAQMGHTRYQQHQESVQISLQHDLPSTRSHITRSIEPMTQISELDDESGYDMTHEASLDASAAPTEHRLATPLQGDQTPATITRRRHSRRHSQSIQPTIPSDSLDYGSELVDNQSASSIDPSQQASTSTNDEIFYDKEQNHSQISSSCIQPSGPDSSLSDTQNLPKALSSEAVDLASAKHFANTPYHHEQEIHCPSMDYSNAPAQDISSSQSITTETSSISSSPLAGSESSTIASAPDAQQIAAQNPAAPRKRNRSSRVSIQELNTEQEMPLGSRRARKSVNYALPKLNTKMRKPDHLMDQDKDKLHPTHDLDSDSTVQDHAQESTPQKVGAAEQVDIAEQAEAAQQEVTAERVKAAEQSETAGQADAANQAEAAERSKAANQANAIKQRNATSSNTRRQLSHQNNTPTTHTLLTSTASLPVRSATPDTKRPMPPSAKLERFRKFSRDPLKERNEQPSAWLLQEQSTQDMPTWASSLLNLASPEPRKSAKSTQRASLEFHGNANLANPPAVSSTESRRARRRSQKENHVR
ncbi:hypothetical protein MYAM1_003776 [Malassezia yamatoensis]|uniref:Shugoshin C-terminal domain-containing protein n=1 Tax=Malassezia yamatoensis TaxID=253288 RepID=A0AAJ5YWS1_9BASI|nr:hypothetical protein MYAM1_003776 [Malassezia yamatoensis]